MEEVGDEFFQDLISKSFLQRSTCNGSVFVMHDFIHELAIFEAGEFCFRLEDGKSHVSEKIRHMSYSRTRFDGYKKFEALHKANRLRTLLPLKLPLIKEKIHLSNKVLHDLVPKLEFLRVLSLSDYAISELPDSVGSLKHLRFLDLSNTAIKDLPNSICTLYNLQTLMLLDCRSLTDLPADIGKLVNLRHLNFRGTNVTQMPGHISRLISLQTLSTFIVGIQSGVLVAELREFQYLRGAIHISALQHVVSATNASQANLKSKKYLEELVLEWTADTQDTQNEREVLDRLQPHIDLKRLTIKSYGGTTFPAWVANPSFSKMVYLCVSNCKNCFSLPPLGQLSSLKELCVTGFDEVLSVGSEFLGDSSANQPFKSLEILKFSDMLEWKEWSFSGDIDGGEFPCLKELHIHKCPTLTGGLPGALPLLKILVISECEQLEASLPRVPAIQKMVLVKCDKVLLRSHDETSPRPLDVPGIATCEGHAKNQIAASPSRVGFHCFSYLENLSFSNLSQMKELPYGLHLLNIKKLEILDCPSLKSASKGGLPATLKTLSIKQCQKLKFLQPEETNDDSFAFLEDLHIWNSCDSLRSFPLALFPKLNYLYIYGLANLETLWIPEDSYVDLPSLNSLEIWLCQKLASFPGGGLPAPNLTFLRVCGCMNLKSLPENMHTVLTSLQQLTLIYCPDIQSFPEGGLPSSLSQLTIIDCDQLMQRTAEWGLQRLDFLETIHIGGSNSEHASLFPEDLLLPPTLTAFSFSAFSKLTHIHSRGLQHLTSLKRLSIFDCPELQCLPEEGLPPSLSFLRISGCPLLKKRCQRETGDDWTKISCINRIEIDGEVFL